MIRWWWTTMGFAVVCCCRSEMCSKIRYYNICDVLLLLFYRLFLNNSSRNPNYRTLISYECRAWDFIHFSNVPHVVAATRRSLPPPPSLDISRARFPNWTRDTDDVIRRRRRWKRGDGGRVYSNAKVGMWAVFTLPLNFLAEDVGQRARRGCSCASEKIYSLYYNIMSTRIHGIHSFTFGIFMIMCTINKASRRLQGLRGMKIDPQVLMALSFILY